MKNIIFIVCSLFSFICAAQTVTGFYIIEPLSSIGFSNEITEAGKKPMTYSYIYNNNTSLQKLISTEKSVEMIRTETDALGGSFEHTFKSSRPSDSFTYKNLDKGIYRVEFIMNNEKMAIADSLTNYTWNLNGETKIVAGYTCKKATTEDIRMGSKQNIVAWYTEAIPVSDGPSNFNGLPGLILELEIDVLTRISFSEIMFQPSKNIIVAEPEKTPFAITVKMFEKINFGIE